MKEFLKSEAWKFVVLAMLVLVGYVVFQANEPLDFHESWSSAERGQMLECFQTCCDAHNQVNEEESIVFMHALFPRNGSWVDRACRWVCANSGSYSRGLLFGYLNRSTRRMIEETASTGNVMLMDKRRRSLLHLSLAYGFNDLAQSLVKRGADVNVCSVLIDGTPGDAPLSWAVDTYMVDFSGVKSLSECREMVDCLLAHGADIKAPVVRGLPVTIKGFLNIGVGSRKQPRNEEAEGFLIYLLEKGAPQEWATGGGTTGSVLSVAIGRGMTGLVRCLLDHGADPSKLTDYEQKKMKKLLEKNDIEES